MKIILMMTGPTRTSWVLEGLNLYASRLRHYFPVESLVLPDVKAAKGLTPDRQKEMEGERMLAALLPGDHLMLLDERGRELTSRQLAASVQELQNRGLRRLVLAIGGPYGFSPAIYARADSQLSLSRMTFTHEMVRLFIMEQLYRAATIIRGEPYHHD